MRLCTCSPNPHQTYLGLLKYRHGLRGARLHAGLLSNRSNSKSFVANSCETPWYDPAAGIFHLSCCCFNISPPCLLLAEAAFHCLSVGYDIQLLFTCKMEIFFKYIYMQIFLHAKWKYLLTISHVSLLSLFLQKTSLRARLGCLFSEILYFPIPHQAEGFVD